MDQIFKYPRTHHIEGSRFQPGDEDLDSVPLAHLQGRHIVIEEKVDGANCGISFSKRGELQLQSRGHYLTGGSREMHFNLLKQWGAIHTRSLWDRLHDRYVLYGEWLYAKHTVFYDKLPHYLMEFDVLDTQEMVFLDTPRRAKLLEGLSLPSVKILWAGCLKHGQSLANLIGRSHFIGDNHLDQLRGQAEQRGLDADRILRETDRSNLMEGLYIKVEEQGIVTERYKFVRADFLTAVVQADGHWLDRPIVPNLLADGIELFAGTT